MFGFLARTTKAPPQQPSPTRRGAPVRGRAGGYDPHSTNGPETPVLDQARLRRALDHAAWRDPSVQRRRDGELRGALAVLERTAACVDMAIERLDEAADAVAEGRIATSPVMRGLLATRTDELLDSLSRISLMAAEGEVNLLDGGQRGLRVGLERGGFGYALNPIALRRDGPGFNIPACETAFEDEDEAEAIALAIERARVRLAQFATRLAHDAATLSHLISTLPDHTAAAPPAAASGPAAAIEDQAPEADTTDWTVDPDDTELVLDRQSAEEQPA